MSARKFVSWEAAVQWLRSQADQRALVEACYYDLPLRAAADRYWSSHEWRAVRSWFRGRGKALDLGAGNGIASYALARDGWDTAALEPDPSNDVGQGAIRALARDAGLAIEILGAFGEGIPLADASLDLVHARQVLHHARDLDALCREVFRVLRPGGMLVATREHVISSGRQLHAFQQNHPLHHLYGGEYAYTLRRYLAALQGAGFRIERVLRPFDTIANYAPLTDVTLGEELGRRAGRLPFGSLATPIFRSQAGMIAVRWILSRVDRRPGRLFSFVATRP